MLTIEQASKNAEIDDLVRTVSEVDKKLGIGVKVLIYNSLTIL